MPEIAQYAAAGGWDTSARVGEGGCHPTRPLNVFSEVQGVAVVGCNQRFGGGYTDLAMVAETHAMHQPAKT